MSGRPNFLAVVFGVVFSAFAIVRPAPATPPAIAPATPATNSVANAVAPLSPPTFAPHVHRFRAIDADNRNVLLNRPGFISVIVGTNEDSQDAARAAGKAMYPFQGRPDFALIVVVDLRHSIASWVPSIVITRMRVSLDQEAIELKPYFLKNGNRSNPRPATHVIPDFTGTICPQLNWKEGAQDLRVIIFGADGREVERLDKVDLDDMPKFQDDVRKAIQAQVDIEQAKLGPAAKSPGWRLFHSAPQHPLLVPYTPFSPKKS
jgi:hypothetical protein